MDIIIIALLMGCSAFLSASEMAFSTVSKARLKVKSSEGNKRAERALKISENFDKALTAILIGNNLVNIASASIGTILFTRIFKESGAFISTVVMTVIVLIFGEILPKSLAKEKAESVCLGVCRILNMLMIILTPFTWFFNKIKSLFNGIIKSNKQPNVTEDELKYIIDESEQQGVLEEQESSLVKSALDFDEIEVSDILVPRVNIIGIEINTSIDDIKKIFAEEMFTRVPVYEKNIDNIVGVINEKDFFKMLIKKNTSLKEIIQKPLYIPEFKLISEVLREMQKAKQHMAIVMDQYGGTKGIVTLEDIIEELVGEIYDENDEVTIPIVKLSDSKYEVSGELSISDMLDELGKDQNCIESSSTTVAGWVMELFGEIPMENQTIQNGSFIITIKEIDEQKIEKIILEIKE